MCLPNIFASAPNIFRENTHVCAPLKVPDTRSHIFLVFTCGDSRRSMYGIVPGEIGGGIKIEKDRLLIGKMG